MTVYFLLLGVSVLYLAGSLVNLIKGPSLTGVICMQIAIFLVLLALTIIVGNYIGTVM